MLLLSRIIIPSVNIVSPYSFYLLQVNQDFTHSGNLNPTTYITTDDQDLSVQNCLWLFMQHICIQDLHQGSWNFMGIPEKPQNSGTPKFSNLLWKRIFVLETSSLFQNSVFQFLTVLTDYSTVYHAYYAQLILIYGRCNK